MHPALQLATQVSLLEHKVNSDSRISFALHRTRRFVSIWICENKALENSFAEFGR